MRPRVGMGGRADLFAINRLLIDGWFAHSLHGCAVSVGEGLHTSSILAELPAVGIHGPHFPKAEVHSAPFCWVDVVLALVLQTGQTNAPQKPIFMDARWHSSVEKLTIQGVHIAIARVGPTKGAQ